MKKNKIVLIIILLVTFLALQGNDVYAKLTTGGVADNSIGTGIATAVKAIAELGMSAAFAALAGLVSLIAGVLFLLMQTIFITGGITENILLMPMPDNVIFNRLSLFDPNFMNPAGNSPLSAMKGVIASIYDSFVVIAIAAFVIIAMVIGIKLAISTLAADKAKYKEAITSWITGIIILLALKWIISAIFIINEQIVQKAFDIAQTSQMKFKVFSLASVPLIGGVISTVMSWFGGDASAVACGDVPGYLGLVLKFLLEGIGGNLFSSIVAFIVLGQTITIIIAYIKRVFYSLLLGLIAPLIVAVDTLNRSTGKQSQLLSNWFKQFTLTVFMQSFHAIMLLVILKLILAMTGNINDGFIFVGDKANISNSVRTLIIIVLTVGLVKFEKMFKQLFGMGDGMVGDLNGAALKSMAALHGAKTAAKAVGDNTKKYKDAAKKKKSLSQQRDWMQREEAARKGLGSSKVPANTDPSTLEGLKNKKYREALDAKASGDMGGYHTKMNEAADAARKAKYQSEMKKIQDERRQAKLRDLDSQIAQETSNMSSAALASTMGPANLIAGAGFGIGLGQDVADAFVKGGYITAALDSATEKLGARGADYQRSRMYDKSKDDGRENSDILRKTTNISQTITNNITPNAKEMKDIISGKWSPDSHRTASSSRAYKQPSNVDDI